MSASLHPLDIIILVAYLVALAGVGIYFSRRQTTLDDFFLAKFYNRLGRGQQTTHGLASADDRHQVFVSRVATVMIGLTGTLLATNVSRIGTLLEIANKLVNAFSGPLFGIYVIAMFSRRATSGPVLAAGLLGSFTSYYVAYRTSIGFLWPSTFGLAATIAVGWGLSLMAGARAGVAAQRLTWHAVVHGPAAAFTPGQSQTTWR